jgi:hypothetical protein
MVVSVDLVNPAVLANAGALRQQFESARPFRHIVIGGFIDPGFDRIRSWDAQPFHEGASFMQKGCRTFYLARKSV